MAVSLRVTPVPQEPSTELPKPAQPQSPTILAAPAHAYLARLAALHDEAAETAHLANLLGRSPYAAGAIGLAALATAFGSASSAIALSIWLALIATSVAVIGRNYSKTIDAPFEREGLKAFVRNVSAALLFAGAAWGAGLSLVLPEGSASAIVFIGALSAVLAIVLRARDMTLCFVVPATAMGAFCALMRDGNLATTAGILLTGLAVAGAAALFEKLSSPVSHPQHG